MSLAKLLTKDNFVKRLRAEGARRYQDRHPFTMLLNKGKLSEKQLQAWILNWFYFQKSLPLKDGAIISNCPISLVRRLWVSRILDHDGYGELEGGIEGWLRFAQASGLDRQRVLTSKPISGVGLAVDSLLDFARKSSWIEGVATSLTQIFLPAVVDRRINALARYYNHIVKPEGLRYFMSLSAQARKDSNTALTLVIKYADTNELREKAIRAVFFSEDVLWSILDAIYSAFVVRDSPLHES